jgi:hypothetical protein
MNILMAFLSSLVLVILVPLILLIVGACIDIFIKLISILFIIFRIVITGVFLNDDEDNVE